MTVLLLFSVLFLDLYGSGTVIRESCARGAEEIPFKMCKIGLLGVRVGKHGKRIAEIGVLSIGDANAGRACVIKL